MQEEEEEEETMSEMASECGLINNACLLNQGSQTGRGFDFASGFGERECELIPSETRRKKGPRLKPR